MKVFLEKIFISISLLFILSLPFFFGNFRATESKRQAYKTDFSQCKDYDCFTKELKADLKGNGIKPMLSNLQSLSTSNDVVKSYCHSIAHELGREAFDLNSGDIGTIFKEGDTTCWSGFYHGALEKAFAKSKNLVETANSLCTSENGVSGSFLYYQCLHGLGHGLSVRFDNEIYQALGVCEKLNDDYQQRSCYGGVFMENYAANPTTGHFPKYLEDSDPIAPCNKVDSKFKYNCYQLVSIQILKLNKYNFGEAFKTCENSDQGFVEVCYQSVGRDISGYFAEDSDKTLAACALGNSVAEKECVWAVASDSVYSKSSEKYVVETCKKAKESTKYSCYQAAGMGIGLLYENRESRLKACSIMERNYITVCEQAAGVGIT